MQNIEVSVSWFKFQLTFCVIKFFYRLQSRHKIYGAAAAPSYSSPKRQKVCHFCVVYVSIMYFGYILSLA